jgi:hypothetical protein
MFWKLDWLFMKLTAPDNPGALWTAAAHARQLSSEQSQQESECRPLHCDVRFIPVPLPRHEIPFGAQSLEALELDMPLALDNAASLRTFTALTELSLPCRRLALEPPAVAQLLSAAGELPFLQRLRVGPLEDAGCCAAAGSDVVGQALAGVRGRRPKLDVELIRAFPVGLLWLDTGNGWQRVLVVQGSTWLLVLHLRFGSPPAVLFCCCKFPMGCSALQEHFSLFLQDSYFPLPGFGENI